MLQVPFAFEFESEWPNGDKTVAEANCFVANLPFNQLFQIGQMVIPTIVNASIGVNGMVQMKSMHSFQTSTFALGVSKSLHIVYL